MKLGSNDPYRKTRYDRINKPAFIVFLYNICYIIIDTTEIRKGHIWQNVSRQMFQNIQSWER
jgi:hypothetical protein